MGQIYGRWIDLEGNLHYYDTERGEVVESNEPPLEIEYKVYIDPMPGSCLSCPMCVDGEDYYYCQLNPSIDAYWGCQFFNKETKKYIYRRPDNCPLCERAKGKWIVRLKIPNCVGSAISNCSNCGCESKTWEKYCPHCGAEMENGEK